MVPLAKGGKTKGSITTSMSKNLNLKRNLANAYASGIPKMDKIRVETVAVPRLNKNA